MSAFEDMGEQKHSIDWGIPSDIPYAVENECRKCGGIPCECLGVLEQFSLVAKILYEKARARNEEQSRSGEDRERAIEETEEMAEATSISLPR